MAEVKWIKINVDMFDDEKIKIVQAMPEGDALLIVWIKLIMLAGKTNDGGYIYISENVPYTDEMLSVIMNKPTPIIRLALDTFAKLGMIENDTNGIFLVNFEKHQSLDRMEKIKEQNRQRVAKFRDKKKQEKIASKNDVTLHVTQCNAIDIDKDIDKENNISASCDAGDTNEENCEHSKDEYIQQMCERNFNIIWDQYPNKKGKTEAFNCFCQYVTKGRRIKTGLSTKTIKLTEEEIENAVRRYAEEVSNVTDKKMIAHGSTFFNTKILDYLGEDDDE